MPGTLRGQLLVAAPSLRDPNFARTVVLIAEHTDEGAMGIVLNRPSETPVADAVPALEDVVPYGEPVYVGGPVQETGAVVLAEFEEPSEAAVIALADVGFLPANRVESRPPSGTRRARVFAGHAGWAAGQLDAELEREDWILEPATPDDAFAPEAAELWSSVLERKGGSYVLVARMPLDPRLN